MAIPVTWVTPEFGDTIPHDRNFQLQASAGVYGPVAGAGWRYRVFGDTTWIALPSTGIIAAGTLTTGSYELNRWIVQQNGDTGEATVFTTALPSSPTPTVSAPTSPITNPTATVTWSTSPTTQYKCQVQVMDGSTVIWDSGEVNQSAQTMANVPFPDTGVTRQVRVRIIREFGNYHWSDWGTTGNLTVTHTPPVTPTISTLVPTDSSSLGFTHTLVAAISQPAPGGGVPAVATTEFYVRRQGENSNGVLVATITQAGGATAFTWTSPAANVVYEMRAKNVAADGRYAYSAWKVASGSCPLKGVVLSIAAGSTGGAVPTTRVFRLNGDEAEDDYQPEMALIQYDGRTFPVVEFGTAASRVLKVELAFRTDADVANLRTLLLSRSVLLYRDRRGRKMYCFVAASGIRDTFFGYTTTLTITALDYPPDRTT